MKALCGRCGRMVRFFLPADSDGMMPVYVNHKIRGSEEYCRGSRAEVPEHPTYSQEGGLRMSCPSCKGFGKAPARTKGRLSSRRCSMCRGSGQVESVFDCGCVMTTDSDAIVCDQHAGDDEGDCE